ncbi:MAG: hypothetical protein LBC53_05955 [Spirochaetaceae bacterium]|jgi:hypothetical protein|nr:hypothetical protein [Spirochaetaceae bacterium]
MGQKELLREKAMELVKRRQFAIRAAAQELKASYRARAADIRRICAEGGCRAYSRECREALESKDGAGNQGKGAQGVS